MGAISLTKYEHEIESISKEVILVIRTNDPMVATKSIIETARVIYELFLELNDEKIIEVSGLDSIKSDIEEIEKERESIMNDIKLNSKPQARHINQLNLLLNFNVQSTKMLTKALMMSVIVDMINGSGKN